MRNLLLVMIAVISIAAIGCGKKKELVIKYPPGTSPGGSSKSAAPPLGRTGGPPPTQQDDSASDDSEDQAEEAASDDAGNDAGEAPAARSQTPATGNARAIGPPRRRSAFRRSQPTPNTQNQNQDVGEAATPTGDTAAAGGGDSSTVSTNPTPPQATEPPETRKSFYDRAVIAFKNDHENEAFQFLYAHALAEDGALKQRPINWYVGVAEPRLALRWGVGIDYNKGRFDGDPPVIGDPISDSTSGGGDAGSDTGSGPPGGSARGIGGSGRRSRTNFSNRNRQTPSNTPAKQFEDPAEELEYYTGDFGRKFINRIEMRRRHPEAFFGMALKDVDLNKSFEEVEESTSPALDPAGGGDFAAAGSGQRRRSRQRPSASDEETDYEAERTSLAPGVMMLGTGNQKSLTEDAQANSLDLLVVFNVKVDHSESRNTTKTKTQARLINVKTGELLGASKTLTNTTVAKARERGSQDDPVELALDEIFKEMTDKDFKAAAMPEIETQYIQQRVNDLVDSKPANPLPQLVEIKYYHEKGIISRDEWINAVEAMLGPDKAKKLIDGDIEDRESAIAAYLPGNFDSGSVNNFR